MGEGNKQKIGLKIILVAFLLSCIIMVVTTPLHEATHWILSDIDPYIEPIEFHLFDGDSNHNNKNIFSSVLGYVIVKEKYPGAFNDRPLWMGLFQELICLTIQILLIFIIVPKILTLLIKRNPNIIKNSKSNL